LLWAMWLKRGKENSYNMLPFLAFETRSSSYWLWLWSHQILHQNLGFITTFVVTCASHDYMIMQSMQIHHLCHTIIDMIIIINVSPCHPNDHGQVWHVVLNMTRHMTININMTCGFYST
jgi:hypothetical protein